MMVGLLTLVWWVGAVAAAAVALATNSVRNGPSRKVFEDFDHDLSVSVLPSPGCSMTEWSECTCDGQQTRAQQVANAAGHLTKPCPALVEIRLCIFKASSVFVRTRPTWSAWPVLALENMYVRVTVGAQVKTAWLGGLGLLHFSNVCTQSLIYLDVVGERAGYRVSVPLYSSRGRPQGSTVFLGNTNPALLNPSEDRFCLSSVCMEFVDVAVRWAPAAIMAPIGAVSQSTRSFSHTGQWSSCAEVIIRVTGRQLSAFSLPVLRASLMTVLRRLWSLKALVDSDIVIFLKSSLASPPGDTDMTVIAQVHINLDLLVIVQQRLDEVVANGEWLRTLQFADPSFDAADLRPAASSHSTADLATGIHLDLVSSYILIVMLTYGFVCGYFQPR